jgi:hypothetical protein
MAVMLATGAAAASACGRWGFSEVVDAQGGDAVPGDGPSTTKMADAFSSIDAAPQIDSPPGVGTYTVAQGSAAYVLLAGSAVPGFAVGADDQNYVVPLPFTFTYYGVAYTSVTVSVNGYLTFGPQASGSDTYQNDCPLDTTPPDAMIAVFWDDLESDPITAPAGYITYATTPSSIAIEWKDMDGFYRAGSGNNVFAQGMRVTQQVVLHDTGEIEMLYGPRTAPTRNHDCGLDRHRGCSATVGLEAPASTAFSNVQCGSDGGPGPGYVPIDEGRTITFTPS